MEPVVTAWFGVRCVFRTVVDDETLYEERVTVWSAADADSAIVRAQTEASEYAELLDAEYLGFAQAYSMTDEPADGAEVFSLLRKSSLAPRRYLDSLFDTGRECQQPLAP